MLPLGPTKAAGGGIDIDLEDAIHRRAVDQARSIGVEVHGQGNEDLILAVDDGGFAACRSQRDVLALAFAFAGGGHVTGRTHSEQREGHRRQQLLRHHHGGPHAGNWGARSGREGSSGVDGSAVGADGRQTHRHAHWMVHDDALAVDSRTPRRRT